MKPSANHRKLLWMGWVRIQLKGKHCPWKMILEFREGDNYQRAVDNLEYESIKMAEPYAEGEVIISRTTSLPGETPTQGGILARRNA